VEKAQNCIEELRKEGQISGEKFDSFNRCGTYTLTRVGREALVPWWRRALLNVRANIPTVIAAVLTSIILPLAVNWLTKKLGWN
jgi:hypothetical protein